MKAADIQSDTLNILLCNRINQFMDIKKRAIRIAKTCKIIRDRTKCESAYIMLAGV